MENGNKEKKNSDGIYIPSLGLIKKVNQKKNEDNEFFQKWSLELSNVEEKNSTEKINIRCNLYASLARIIIAHEDLFKCCTVFVYEKKFYFAIKLNQKNVDQENRQNQKEREKREKNLLILKGILNSQEEKSESRGKTQKKLFDIIASTTFNENRKASLKVKSLKAVAIKKNVDNDIRDNIRKICNNFEEWSKIFSDITKNKCVVKNRETKDCLNRLQSSITNAIKGYDSNDSEKSIAIKNLPALLETIIYMRDYYNIIDDIDNYHRLLTEGSILSEAWDLIKQGQWKDVSGFEHSELSVIQHFLSQEQHKATRDFKKILESAQLRSKNPLVSSMWNCYLCWETINCGGIVFSCDENKKNLNLKNGVFYINWNSYLHFNERLLEKMDSETDKSIKKWEKRVSEVVEDDLSKKEIQKTSSWIKFQSILKPELFSQEQNTEQEVIETDQQEQEVIETDQQFY